MSAVLDFYVSNYKQSTAVKKSCPEYKAWSSAWLSSFQKNTNAGHWPEVCEKLLLACQAGKMELVKKCWWASMMGAELAPDSLPAVVAWGMKRAASIEDMQNMYELMNVKLGIEDIRGESFYGGFPNPTESDKLLGEFLNKMEIY